MRCLLCAAAALGIPIIQPVLAGSFSTGRSNLTVGAPDPGIPGFVGSAGNGSTASPNVVNPVFKSWASGYVDYLPAPGVGAAWNDPSVIVGPVSGDNFDVVSLGDLNSTQISGGAAPGEITATFSSPIVNGAGADFAVFENSFGTDASVFVELAYVQVSSDGTHFAQFPARSTNTTQGSYVFTDPTNIHHLAGKHVNAFGQSWGTPFDLADLSGDPLVASGVVDLGDIRFVRFIDIPGSGAFKDSQNSPIYDSWVTSDSGGFDLQAVGVINTVAQLLADANGDGRVNTLDFNALAAHFGVSGGASLGQGDFDADGAVDSDDFVIFAGQYGKTSGVLTGSVIPEPAVGSLLVLGCAYTSRFVCRRKNA